MFGTVASSFGRFARPGVLGVANRSLLGARFLSVSVGDAIPSVSLDKGFPPQKFPLADFCKGKKVVLVGLPGAFTPT